MKYPKHIYLYVCDYDKTEPLYAVATTLAEIPEDQHGESVSKYVLEFTSKLSVKKAILGEK